MNWVSSAGSSTSNSAEVQFSRISPAVASARLTGTRRGSSCPRRGSTMRWVTACATGSTTTRLSLPYVPSVQLTSAPMVNCSVPGIGRLLPPEDRDGNAMTRRYSRAELVAHPGSAGHETSWGLFAFDVDDLVEGVPHLDQVGRVGHDLADGLVGGGNLVEERAGVPPFDALHNCLQLGTGKGPLGGPAAVGAAGAVWGGVQRQPVALAGHDGGGGAHGGGDQAQRPGGGVDSALA